MAMSFVNLDTPVPEEAMQTLRNLPEVVDVRQMAL
jgi:hypothetical protein